MRAFVLVLMTVRPLVSLSAQGRPTVILDNHCFDSLPDSHQPRSCASISLLDLRAPLKEVRSRTLAAFAADSLAAEVRASSGDSVDAVVLSQPFDAQCLPGLPKESLDVRVGPVSTQFTTFLANRYRPIAQLRDSSASSIRILVHAQRKNQGSAVMTLVVAYAPGSDGAPPLRVALCYMTHVLVALGAT